MKKTILLLLLVILGLGSLFAQIRKVPAKVTNAFKLKYPAAENVEWKDELKDFQASFTLNSTEVTADFSRNGKWKEASTKMKFEDAPAAIKDGFQKSKFNDWTPGSVTKMEKHDKATQYKVYVEKSSIVQKRFLYFNEQGQLQREGPGI